MPRGRSVEKRETRPDPLYNSKLVSRMINNLMFSGKKSVAQALVYGSLKNLSEDKLEQVQIFETAIRNVIPSVEVRSRRVGGANYQVPVPVRHDRGEALAVRWIIDAARSRKGSPMITRLTQELKDASAQTGDAIRKKELTYKMAEANRAFSHFRW